MKKGDVLARVDPARYRLALSQATAAVVQRQHVMLERQREATRRVHLFTIAIISVRRPRTRAPQPVRHSRTRRRPVPRGIWPN